MNLKFAFSAGLAAITVTGMIGGTAERDDERTKQEMLANTVCVGLDRVIAGVMRMSDTAISAFRADDVQHRQGRHKRHSDFLAQPKEAKGHDPT